MSIIFGIPIIIILVPISIVVLSIVFICVKIDEAKKKENARKKLEEEKKKQEEERKATEQMRIKVRETELYNQIFSFFCKWIDTEINYTQKNIATIQPRYYSENIFIGEEKSWIGYSPKTWNTLVYKDFGIDYLYSREHGRFRNTLMFDLEQKYPELDFRFDYDDYRGIEINFMKVFKKISENNGRKPIC